ncbi:hypothetical protein GGR53DRAFT_498140 [Hypoxylon sp. FL1150]|nr:hypothetical protein GGR53DRAFT_498140 [Hypoxylon sp. FL1150]
MDESAKGAKYEPRAAEMRSTERQGSYKKRKRGGSQSGDDRDGDVNPPVKRAKNTLAIRAKQPSLQPTTTSEDNLVHGDQVVKVEAGSYGTDDGGAKEAEKADSENASECSAAYVESHNEASYHKLFDDAIDEDMRIDNGGMDEAGNDDSETNSESSTNSSESSDEEIPYWEVLQSRIADYNKLYEDAIAEMMAKDWPEPDTDSSSSGDPSDDE